MLSLYGGSGLKQLCRMFFFVKLIFLLLKYGEFGTILYLEGQYLLVGTDHFDANIEWLGHESETVGEVLRVREWVGRGGIKLEALQQAGNEHKKGALGEGFTHALPLAEAVGHKPFPFHQPPNSSFCLLQKSLRSGGSGQYISYQ